MVVYRCDSDLRLLGNGFRFTEVFSVVKNAGVLKKRCPCRPFAVGAARGIPADVVEQPLARQAVQRRPAQSNGKTALGDPADKALGEIRRQIFCFDDAEGKPEIAFLPLRFSNPSYIGGI